jgi:murein DD-endopeptidase MepM/ murein hydrolase activator NlpD
MKKECGVILFLGALAFGPVEGQVPGKDIIITTLSASPGTLLPGQNTSLAYRVYNQGTRMITESYTEKIYLSANPAFDTTARFLRSSEIHTTDLGANGGFLAVTLAVLIPANTAAGTYYLIVRGDATGMIAEASEANNDRSLKIAVGAPVLSAPTEENNRPTLVPVGTSATSLSAGTNHFKFEVEPGYFYSFIVNSGSTYDHSHVLRSRGAPAVLYSGYTGNRFQAVAASETYPTCKDRRTGARVPETQNPTYAKSAIQFFADPAYYSGRYYDYVYVDSFGPAAGTVYLKLLKSSQKAFAAPFAGGGIIDYYNSLHHRADIHWDGTCTDSGHLGIDIAPETASFEIDLERAVVPVADGTILGTANLGSLGYAVWVYHESLGYTSLYAHLQSLSLTRGPVTRSVTKLGTVHSGQKHLHLEILPGKSTAWNGGYATGTSNVDPLVVIFER